MASQGFGSLRETRMTMLRAGSPLAQVVLAAFGIFSIVIGTIALGRAGLDDLTGEQTVVLGMTMTPLLAVIHLGIGLLALLGAMGPRSARGTGIFLGAVMIAMGILALVQTYDELAWTDTNGVAYLITGAIVWLASLIPPMGMIRTERRVADDERRDRRAM